jgi:predicted nucleic acid-binding protein
VKRVFADTSFYIALIRKADVSSDIAVRYTIEFRGEYVTTDYILLELANWFARSMQRQSFVDLYRNISGHRHTTIIPASRRLMNEGMDLYASMNDKGWSLTDCISFNIMREEDIQSALTADRHFIQAGFRALLAE